MSKEMIISVNGREKRIAILENGQVTEFYIERGEENSGVVGNIYKGRVQRVLPGMQSAFVEIGLERDAFLYVSDFFDEEEEFERIMMEKTKKSPPEVAARDAAEQIKKARLEREHQIEEIQEIVEPLIAAPAEIGEEAAAYDEDADGFEAVEDLSAGEEENPARRAEEFEESRGRRGKRDKGRRGKQRESAAPAASAAADRTRETEDAFESRETESLPFFETPDDDRQEEEETASPLFEIEDSGFERVIDDEETPGEIFKDAFLQEAIIDKVRAVEFDMESTATAEVGSLLDSVSDMPNGFQRIADEDEAGSETAPAAAAAGTAAREEEKPRKSKRGRGGSGRKSRREEQSETGSESPAAEETAAATEEETGTAREESAAGSEEPKRGRGGKSKKDTGKAKEQKTEGKEKSTRGRKSAKNKNEGEAPLADAEASVTEPAPDIAEMAVRRGGRRRGGGGGGNRPGGRQQPQQARSGPTEDRFESSKMDETISSAENEFADAEMIENSGDGSSGGGTTSRSNGGSGYQPGGGRRETRRERERNQPTITDLLREGQEILVQIAKEPIARKGARITSHIALPGRYLVYMPTIEHVGVSRKIESGGERNRLRTLIQKIRNEEDVPSGGFIVRTAGIGVPEENLREDARYLVRTWKDVKRTAEKSKSPALVHQDLDIIQRILRDQLSDDFTAIRVDSEEEYLRIVEFVNRIQPRMVNRVKLYTRDEPILEAFNVQEEIDKALKPRVWLRSGGYLVINQTEALVAIDVNTGKFVGKGNARLEDTITKTNMEAVEEISRQIRLRDLGGIIVLDLIDMEDRRNRQKVLQALQEHLSHDKSPTKVLSFNDFGLIIMTRKRVKQSLERTLCAPCAHCQGAGWVKSPQTVCYNILEEARRLSRHASDVRLVTLRVHPEVLKALRGDERVVLEEIEAYLGAIDITSDPTIHEEQFDFAFI
jgi:ribonuclease G